MHELDRVAPKLVAFFAVAVASSCLVDGDAPCGPKRILGPQNSCLCPNGLIEATNGVGCVEARPPADTGFVVSSTVSDGGTSADAGASPAPTGLGEACTTSGDCAAFDASYCETFQSHVCLIEGCSLQPDDCPSGWSCCDLSSFGMPHLCVTAGSCPI